MSMPGASRPLGRRAFLSGAAGAAAWLATGRRARRASSLVYNVRSFGASCNGTTDDYQAILAADAALKVAGGGTLLFPGMSRTSMPLSPASGNTWSGVGRATSGLTVLPTDYENFGYSFVVQGDGTDVTITDLRIDCQRRFGTNPPNRCGCIRLGPRWLVRQVDVYDPNYFGVWVGPRAVEAEVFDCASFGGGNNDAIGGGGGWDVRIIGHRWDATCEGNRFDNVKGTDIVLEDCLDESPHPGGFYLEGMTRSGLRGCRLFGAADISIQSDGGYQPVEVTNPLECFAIDNYLVGNPIQVEYDQSYPPANVGGGNVISHNVVQEAPRYGILVLQGREPRYSSAKDVVVGNTVINPNTDSVPRRDTGIGVVPVGAIVCDRCGPTWVLDNRTRDDRHPPLTQAPVAVMGGGPVYVADNVFGPSLDGITALDGAVVVAHGNRSATPDGHRRG